MDCKLFLLNLCVKFTHYFKVSTSNLQTQALRVTLFGLAYFVSSRLPTWFGSIYAMFYRTLGVFTWNVCVCYEHRAWRHNFRLPCDFWSSLISIVRLTCEHMFGMTNRAPAPHGYVANVFVFLSFGLIRAWFLSILFRTESKSGVSSRNYK